jgi:hypothetical protein
MMMCTRCIDRCGNVDESLDVRLSTIEDTDTGDTATATLCAKCRREYEALGLTVTDAA